MIDKMKEVAIKQFQQQQEVIDDKNREITLLIEHKNKEVIMCTYVIRMHVRYIQQVGR